MPRKGDSSRKLSPTRKTETQTINFIFGTVDEKPNRKTCPSEKTLLETCSPNRKTKPKQ